jgi:hypothetical protein
MASARQSRPIPSADRADFTAAPLRELVSAVDVQVSAALEEDEAKLIAQRVNNYAYYGRGSFVRRDAMQEIERAAIVLSMHLLSLGEPLQPDLQQLQDSLGRATPHLIQLNGWPPKGEPYYLPCLTIHTHMCTLCRKAGREVGFSRQSIAIKLTAAVLRHLGYTATPSSLETFFQNEGKAARDAIRRVAATELRGRIP